MVVENSEAPETTPLASDSTAAHAVAVGNPMLVALPTFLVGSITLGLWLVDYLPTALPGGLVAGVFFASGVGVILGATWAARLGQSAVAGVLATFGTFWLSFGVLVFGLVNGLFGVSTTDVAAAGSQVQSVQATFLLSWLIVLVVMTLATTRLPLAYTVLFVLVDIALALVLAGVLAASSALLVWGGIAVFGFCLVGAYLFYGAMSEELGRSSAPLGAPLTK
uniref:GPR1/FUN34/yaaH family protein n=1 Tax=Pseudonocardia sp. ENV478 TaxID=377619 RepID=F8SXW2_9PSEU|nr:hypothetical protein [Pseudonocardia sp. ENV478]